MPPLTNPVPIGDIKWHGRPLPSLTREELLACCSELFNAYQELAARSLQDTKRLSPQDFIDAIREVQK